jgi:hypothetical protein
MALTDQEKQMMVRELNMSFFGVMSAVADAMTDDPATPGDESKFSGSEVATIMFQAGLMGTAIAQKARRMSGADWTEVMAEWSAQAGL